MEFGLLKKPGDVMLSGIETKNFTKGKCVSLLEELQFPQLKAYWLNKLFN